jgi:hypothetical protein
MSGTWNGNVVAYGSGGHWYVQVFVTDNGPTTAPTTGLHIWSRVVFENSIVDSSNTINGSDPAGSWSANNYPFNGADSYDVMFREFECGILYGGSTAHIVVYATGMATGGTGPSQVVIDYPMPARLPMPPDPPNVGVDSVTTTSAHVFVTAAGDEHGAGADYCNYRIHRVSDGAWMGDIGGPGIGYGGVYYTNLALATTYDAYCQTHNAAGYGGFGGPARFTTPATVPGPPTVSASAVTATSATINVGAAAANGNTIDLYETYVATDSGFLNVIRYWTGGSGAISGLTRATSYFARSRAHNGLGWGPFSTTWNFITLSTIPSAPGTPTTPTINPDSATITWTPPTDNGGSTVTSYTLQVALNSTFTSGLTYVTTSATSGVYPGLTPGTQYYTRVAATNGIGTGPWSGIGTFTTMAGIKVKVAGIWVNAKLWVKVAGNWVPAKVWKKNDSGNWVI